MGYTALYRKFRPTKFSDIVGQEHITKTLKNQIIAGRVGHAYLFNGGRGTGKTTAAKILARAINCLNPKDGEPCNDCEICRGALDGSLTDIVEMDAASNNSVEDVRDIREAVNFLPTKAKYRVYIIDEVHMISIPGFNALLKTLEEPPEHVKFILATTEPQKIPATILSRCQRFDFKRISNDNIIKRLKVVCDNSKIEISDEALNLISILAEGGMRDALSILERCNQDGEDTINEEKIRDLVGIPSITYIMQISEALLKKDSISCLQIVENVLNQGKDLNNLIWELIKYVKDILLFKSTSNIDTYSIPEKSDIERLSGITTKEDLMNLISCLFELENKVKMSSQKTIVFQAGIIKICNNVVSSNEPSQIQSSTAYEDLNSLAKRVTKIENFLKASNFVGNGVSPKVTINVNSNTVKEPPMPKYEGKTQDYWPKLVNDFKTNGKMFMYINLAGTIAKEINDMTIAIEFPNGISAVTRDFLEKPENKLELKRIIGLSSGKEMQIKYIDTKPKKQESFANGFENYIANSDINFNII